MIPQPSASAEAVAARLRVVRMMRAQTQTAFADFLGIETTRWNQIERGSPLSKEVALLIVARIPGITLDWLFLGKTGGLTVMLLQELEEAERKWGGDSCGNGQGLGDEGRYREEGRRLRWLRKAEGIPTALAFAEYIGWTESSMSRFENGQRRVSADKALQLRAKIPGFDPVWLWEGDKRGLSLDLRERIEAEEAKEGRETAGNDPLDQTQV
jgi:transcriptional regulator with XRE-family HTH domain